MKPKRKIGRYIFGVLLLGVLVWGGLLVKNHLDFQNEMVRIVHSQEVKKLIVDDLKQEDPDAFTENGKIQSYEIDDETIEHNPMGGIMFHVILNSDEKLVVYYTLQKDSRTGKIEYSGGGYTEEVAELIGEGK